eukprot:10408781-Alexandrium_andersonii.AAC.1
MQGASSSPHLFTLPLIGALQELESEAIARGWGLMLDDKRYLILCWADDLWLLASAPEQLQHMCEFLVQRLASRGLRVDWEKKAEWTSNR